MSLPTGTVTFLFTDVEGSTRLWEQHPDAARAALEQHDALIEFLTEQHRGQVVRPRGEGDSRFCVFARASDAVAAAAAIQRALCDERWPTPAPLKVRMALHTGEADVREGDYYGSAVNRCARLRAIACGGQALLSQATADLVHDAGAPLRDLGEHRLKDLSRPERVYQLGDGEFPPLRSLDALPNNLPPQLTSFVGRERESAQVRQLLGVNRLVTLTGTGGAGKTRLALQAAAELVDNYPDGAWFVDLAPVADELLVPGAALSAVGLREVPGRPALEALTEYLRSRTLLLVLDNCEHLIAACAEMVDALLRACPRLRVLATSRELLGVPGEATWRVPSLALPPDPSRRADAETPAAGPAALLEYESARLFVERARLVQPGFAVTDANAAAVAQLCRRLDGIPLALELAAARVRGMTVEQVAARLDDRFRLLTGGARTALRRQQTLEALVDWSYDLLSEDERALLRRLSVFAGGWTLEAAEAVGEGLPDVLALLLQLVDKSLVIAEGDGGDEERYRLLETIRQYAQERLVHTGEAAAARERHLDYYLAWAERAAPEVTRREQLIWYRRIEAELDNLRAALEWSAVAATVAGSASGSPDRELRLAAALGHFWLQRSYLEEGRARLLAAIERGRQTPSPARAVALIWAGHITWFGDDNAGARRLYEDAIATARAVDAKAVLANALRHLAIVDRPTSDSIAEVAALLEEAVAAARAANHPRETGYSLTLLARALMELEGEAASQRMLTEAQRILREVGDRDALGINLMTSGDFALRRGDRAGARAFYEEALAVSREMDMVSTTIGAQIALGDVSRAEGELDAARARYLAALRIGVDRGHRSFQSHVRRILRKLAGLGVAAGDPVRAARGFAAEAAVGQVPPWSRRVDRYDDEVAAVRAALGEAAFAAAWAEGEALTLEETIAETLREG